MPTSALGLAVRDDSSGSRSADIPHRRVTAEILLESRQASKLKLTVVGSKSTARCSPTCKTLNLDSTVSREVLARGCRKWRSDENARWSRTVGSCAHPAPEDHPAQLGKAGKRFLRVPRHPLRLLSRVQVPSRRRTPRPLQPHPQSWVRAPSLKKPVMWGRIKGPHLWRPSGQCPRTLLHLSAPRAHVC